MLRTLIFVAWFLILPQLTVAQIPPIYTEKVADYPDIWQKDPRGHFPGGGGELCCAASVSSSLIYFAGHGYPALTPNPGPTTFDTQAALIRLLTSANYFNTDLNIGTPPSRMISGTEHYVKERGYHVQRVEYSGWRSLGKAQENLVVAPLVGIDWLKQGIANPNGAVWINVGWYSPGKASGTWIRYGGHWITLVGYGEGNHLLIHNSLIHRTTPIFDYSAFGVNLVPLPPHGTFTVDHDTTVHSTRGMFQVEGPGLPCGNSVAFVDAAILFVIGK